MCFPLSNAFRVEPFDRIRDYDLYLLLAQIELALVQKILLDSDKIFNLCRMIDKGGEKVESLDNYEDVGRQRQEPAKLRLVGVLPLVVHAYFVSEDVKSL